ncbi:protein tas-like [Salvia splendens]|uniref:protein tas-like n=1 Tax=Salvia splendens TaxID=180675 RepID=UPI001C25E8A8|nr:protein tas-like [Salvia splendens]
MAVPLFNLAPDMAVSRLCLGTMTFGEQNSMSQSFQLLDKAFQSGINFFDSAEMYPVPQRAETQGKSEEYLGHWIRSRNIPRDRLVLATKVCGPSGKMTWIRNGPESVDSRNIAEALDNSLLRLQSDYIDLYQVHWPDRYVPMFGETEFDSHRNFPYVSFEEQLIALEKAICSGKIRYIGLSNETPYGLMKFLHVAEGLSRNPRVVSVQNAYNLLCRNFDSGMAECCHHERVSLLAYSPLAMGILSGKYLSLDGGPSDARLNLFKGRYAEGESRYNLSDGITGKAARLYFSIAKKYDVHPVSFAIAFVLRHPLVASAVFGATKLWQLQEVLDGCRVELTPEIIAEINEVHSAFPNPCP